MKNIITSFRLHILSGHGNASTKNKLTCCMLRALYTDLNENLGFRF
jgi:hypothetical protein